MEGIKVLDVYEDGRKVRDLSLLECNILLSYDDGVPACAIDQISDLFSKDSVFVPKKTKNGIQDQNIVTMIHDFQIEQAGEKALTIRTLIACQNPTLNPAQIVFAIGKYLPELEPSNTFIGRLEVFDINKTIFR